MRLSFEIFPDNTPGFCALDSACLFIALTLQMAAIPIVMLATSPATPAFAIVSSAKIAGRFTLLWPRGYERQRLTHRAAMAHSHASFKLP